MAVAVSSFLVVTATIVVFTFFSFLAATAQGFLAAKTLTSSSSPEIADGPNLKNMNRLTGSKPQGASPPYCHNHYPPLTTSDGFGFDQSANQKNELKPQIRFETLGSSSGGGRRARTRNRQHHKKPTIDDLCNNHLLS